MTTHVPVNPDLINWALERAGVSADALVGRFPKLHEWLTGELTPTLKQLESFATATHTAIGLLLHGGKACTQIQLCVSEERRYSDMMLKSSATIFRSIR